MENKICTKCNEPKMLCQFGNNKNNPDGLHHHCKECRKIYSLNHRKVNNEILKQKDKERYNQNKEIILARNKKYRLENNSELYEKAKEWKINNTELVSNYQKEYRKNNAVKISHYKKEYKQKNKHIIAWRMVLYNSLKRMGKPKEGHTIDLLGYSAEELKNHLESLFTEGMTWDNYGEWHIDHIKGVINFDADENPNVVNALSNLRPIWATTRIINGVLYEGNLNRPKYKY